MATQNKILVLFEDGVIRKEGVLYTIELARRLELAVVLLMLVSTGANISGMEDTLAEEWMEPIERAQIEVSRHIRYGDKATELLKYLAANSNPAAIVWGSDKKMAGKLGAGRSHHWLSKLSSLLSCSIVSPIPKNKDENK